MKVSELEDGQTVSARWGRAGEMAVNWGPWTDVVLYVQRDRKGAVFIIALKDSGWAEYDPRYELADDPSGRLTLLTEDYYLQIEGLARG